VNTATTLPPHEALEDAARKMVEAESRGEVGSADNWRLMLVRAARAWVALSNPPVVEVACLICLDTGKVSAPFFLRCDHGLDPASEVSP